MALHYTYTSPNNNLASIAAAVRANLLTIGPTIMPALAGAGPEAIKEACYAEVASGTQFTGSPPTLHFASSYTSPNAGITQLAQTANLNMQTAFQTFHPTLKLGQPQAPATATVNTNDIGQFQWAKIGLICEVIAGTSFVTIPLTSPAFTYSLTGTSDAAYFIGPNGTAIGQVITNFNSLLGNANMPVPWAPLEVVLEATICEILFGSAYTNV